MGRKRALLLPVLILAWWTSGLAMADEAVVPNIRPDTGDVRFVSGNGGLTAGFDAAGALVSCRWPSPGYEGQLGPALPGAPEGKTAAHKAFTWVRWGRTVRPVFHSAWRVLRHGYAAPFSNRIETVLENTENAAELRQEILVDPAADCMTIHLSLRNAPPDARFGWYQNFDPCTRHVPELPAGDWAFPETNDFAAFAQPGPPFRIYQFRPAAPGAAQWEDAERLARQNAPASEWTRLAAVQANDGRAVWIGLATANPVRAYQCGPDTGPESPLRQTLAGTLSGRGSAVGPCAAALELEPTAANDLLETTLVIAFAATKEAVDTMLETALCDKRSFQRRCQENDEAVQAWLESCGTKPRGAGNETSARCLLTLRAAMDRQSGAVVRAPLTYPPLALVTAKSTAWVATALDHAGAPDLAGKTLRFLLQCAREREERGAPPGSLAAAYYADGVEAAFPGVTDAEAPAWLLTGVWRHASALTDEARGAWLSDAWPAMASSAGWLAAWGRGLSGAPPPSHNLQLGRDTQDDGAALYPLMGLTAALQMAGALNKRAPESWSRRRDELENLLRWRMTGAEAAPLAIDPTLPSWLRTIIPPNRDSVWTVPVQVGAQVTPLRATPPVTEAAWRAGMDVDTDCAAIGYWAAAVSSR